MKQWQRQCETVPAHTHHLMAHTHISRAYTEEKIHPLALLWAATVVEQQYTSFMIQRLKLQMCHSSLKKFSNFHLRAFVVHNFSIAETQT